ncbi:MAG: hypothetical protein ACRD3G_04580 [Vicinamibacterales bacterium]
MTASRTPDLNDAAAFAAARASVSTRVRTYRAPSGCMWWTMSKRPPT